MNIFVNIADIPLASNVEYHQKSTWLRNNRTPEEKVLRYMRDVFTNRRQDVSEKTHSEVITNWPRLADNPTIVSYFELRHV